jgi:osmotically-inducible protein OsmY
MTMLNIQTPRHLVSLRPVSENDEALQKTAVSLLKESGYSAVARLECRVDHGVVELAGVVPSFYLKQVAQAVIQRLERVQGIRNEVQVL